MAVYTVRHSSVGKTTHRPGTAAAHIRYIARRSAASLIMAEGMPQDSRTAQGWINQQAANDRKNARIIDRVMVTLPRELHPLQQQKLIRQFVRRITKGRAPWLAAIHDRGKDAHNPHAHIVIRDRDPETGRRVARLSEKGSTNWLRLAWEECANEALECAGRPERVTRHRTKGEPCKTPVWASTVLAGGPPQRRVRGFAPANP